jgi:drug/metabolite transporter (DMT)-like permease
LLPGALANGFAEVSAIGWARALTLTFVAGPLQALISYLGFTMVPLGHGVVIQPAASALAGLLLAVVALREPTTARRMLGVGAIVVGLSLFGAEATTTIGPHGLLGDFLFLVAGIAWGVFGVLLRHWRIAGTRAAIVICVLALLIYAPVHGLICGYDKLIAAGLKENLVQVMAQGVLAGVGAIYLFARCVSLLGASRASTFPALVPAFGIVIGYLALGEVPTVYQLAGLALVALGFRLALKQ